MGGKNLFYLGYIEFVKAPIEHGGKVVAQIGYQASPGRCNAWIVGNQGLFDAQFLEQETDQEGSAAAKAKENEIARVVAAVDRDTADAAGNAIVGHGDNRTGRLFGR